MSVSIDLRKRLSRDVKTFRMKYQRIQHLFVNLSRLSVEKEYAMIERENNNRRESNNRKKNAFEYNSEHSLNVLAETCLKRSFDEESSK
jgi:hypothetical protein